MNDSQIENLPKLMGLAALFLETERGVGQLQRLAYFHWEGKDYWLLGKMVWRNTMRVQGALISLPLGRRTFSAGMVVRPDCKPPTFSVSPLEEQRKKCKTFIFSGFDEMYLIDIEFARYEHERLAKLPYVWRREDEVKSPRPPLGQIV